MTTLLIVGFTLVVGLVGLALRRWRNDGERDPGEGLLIVVDIVLAVLFHR